MNDDDGGQHHPPPSSNWLRSAVADLVDPFLVDSQGALEAVPDDRMHLVQFTDCENASTYGCCVTVTEVLQVNNTHTCIMFCFFFNHTYLLLLAAYRQPPTNPASLAGNRAPTVSTPVFRSLSHRGQTE